MSYQVLARKWRPQTFADVVGREHVLTALANGLSLGRIHHAYLFPAPVASENLYRPTAGEGAKLRNRHYRDAVRRAITVVKSSRGALSI